MSKDADTFCQMENVSTGAVTLGSQKQTNLFQSCLKSGEPQPLVEGGPRFQMYRYQLDGGKVTAIVFSVIAAALIIASIVVLLKHKSRSSSSSSSSSHVSAGYSMGSGGSQFS